MKINFYSLRSAINSWKKVHLTFAFPARLLLILMTTGGCLVNSAFLLGQPVASPNVKCLAVNPVNGDVTLHWATPTGPGGFLNYQVYAAPAALGPYTLVGTIGTYAQTTFVHGGAGANLARVYYKVQTEYNPGPVLAAPADTFSTIFLQVSAGVGVANLSWNKISIQNISTSSGWYLIYREYPTGVWTLRDSTQTLSYVDVIDICSAVLNYRIEIKDNSGCSSVSNIGGGIIFSDKNPPALALIDTVSVDPVSSFATISWTPSPSADADSVVIYTGGGPWIPIDTVPVPQTSYTYTASNAANTSEQYRIAALDSCGNISILGTLHQTIYLSVSFDICSATADLIWNKYVNWSPGVTQYEIWKSTNGGNFIQIGSNISSDTTYQDTGLVLGTPYCYFVRATNGVKTSSSNRVCFSPNVTQPPAYAYARFATVITDKSILIKAHVDPTATSVKNYSLLRANNPGGSFSVLTNTLVPTGSTITYTDKSVNAATTSYIYKLNAMDSCGHVITSTNEDTTILLGSSVAPNLDITLSWNDYGSFDAKVHHYDIYRSIDGTWDPLPINPSPIIYTGGGGTYTDDIALYMNSKGNFAYYVVAVEDTGNTYGFTDSSASNITRVDQYPKFYVPNTFTPNGDGINDVFIPVIGFVDATAYSLMIFDRTGTPIFESKDPAEGWDGTKKGHPCQSGVYMYLIKCKASNGDDSKISGTISLFR